METVPKKYRDRICDVVDEVKLRHETVFKDMLERLGTDALSVEQFRSITQETFSGGINWGRIISVLATSSYVREDDVQAANNVFVDLTNEWINENGGWEHAAIFFSQHMIDMPRIFTTFMVLGITATVIYWLIR